MEVDGVRPEHLWSMLGEISSETSIQLGARRKPHPDGM
jgi:hypothetical protein